MRRMRCTICRQVLPTIKTLKSHYVGAHSKHQLTKKLLQTQFLSTNPNLWVKSRKQKREIQRETFFLNGKVHITYNNEKITIEDESREVFEMKLEEDSSSHELKWRRNKEIEIDIQREFFSLNEETGEFYECHCMENNSLKTSSDTESCSETGRTLYSSVCGNGINSQGTDEQELFDLQMNNNNYFNLEPRLIRLYVCSVCGFEFLSRDFLMDHLKYHFEQQTFENILNMEQEYTTFCNNSTIDYHTNISNILFFLTYPYDRLYSRSMFVKIACDLCYQEFFINEYEQHLKNAHYLNQ